MKKALTLSLIWSMFLGLTIIDTDVILVEAIYNDINIIKTNTVDETARQARNLAKLCKVWGFTKYTHMTFLTGERCWDDELLNLITIIRFANEEDVNDILYEWFKSLGNDGYDLGSDVDLDQLRADFLGILFMAYGGFYASRGYDVEPATGRLRFTANTAWISD